MRHPVIVLLFASTILSIQGCCEEDVTPPNGVTKALWSNPLSTFIDSSGNYLQILVIDSGYDISESGSMVNDYDGCPAYVPRTAGIFFPIMPDEQMRYSQMYNYDHLTVLDVSFSTSAYTNALGIDTNILLQGMTYSHAKHFSKRDSTGLKSELALHPQYGIILFRYGNQYRWERVLNP
ncbi:MAG: hypothetical protein K9J06_13355 [Flavobacteriales bacterium]|nr:hypothetical protein [Flavobacteriales bacterium]